MNKRSTKSDAFVFIGMGMIGSMLLSHFISNLMAYIVAFILMFIGFYYPFKKREAKR
jgi:putative Mn2+ efflux pump MntP